MASISHLFSSLLVISLLLLSINESHSSFEQNSKIINDEKVNVSLYYETLCPGCQNFIVTSLAMLYNMKDMMKIINLHLVPYGNAKRQGSDIVCQHGPKECYYNTIEACALDAWPLEKSYPFIYCVELQLQKQYDEKIWESCCNTQKLDPQIIRTCNDSGHGDELIRKNANETEALQPPHEYVPWVTVNKKPVNQKFDVLITEICNAYKGEAKPISCERQETKSIENKSSKFAVCHANDENMTLV